MFIDIRVGQVLRIGDAQIELVQKSGQLARLRVKAPASTAITPPNRSAHECAPTPAPGKEHPHAQPALP